jgi:hypothetical protein
MAACSSSDSTTLTCCEALSSSRARTLKLRVEGCNPFLILAKLRVQSGNFTLDLCELRLHLRETFRQPFFLGQHRLSLGAQLFDLALEGQERSAFGPGLRAADYQAAIDDLLAVVSNVDLRGIFDRQHECGFDVRHDRGVALVGEGAFDDGPDLGPQSQKVDRSQHVELEARRFCCGLIIKTLLRE